MRFSKQEKEAFSKGCQRVAGVDEAGRGAWAGPIVAAAVAVSPDMNFSRPNIRDSKTLSKNQRSEMFGFISKYFNYGVGVVGAEMIDEMGIQWANREAMIRAIDQLSITPNFVFIDGRGFSFDFPYQNIVDGDATIFSISAASIVAKVVRDEMMKKLDEVYCGYNFCAHKGYGTREHSEKIRRFGICPLHRRSYAPIARFAKMLYV